MPKPIEDAKKLARELGYTEIIIYDKEHTYGESKEDCTADNGNKIKRLFEWPEEHCKLNQQMIIWKSNLDKLRKLNTLLSGEKVTIMETYYSDNIVVKIVVPSGHNDEPYVYEVSEDTEAKVNGEIYLFLKMLEKEFLKMKRIREAFTPID